MTDFYPTGISTLWSDVKAELVAKAVTLGSRDFVSYATELMSSYAISNRVSIKNIECNLYLEQKFIDDFRELLESWGGHIVCEKFDADGQIEEGWIWPQGAVGIEHPSLVHVDDDDENEDGDLEVNTQVRVDIQLVTLEISQIESLQALFKKHQVEKVYSPPPRGKAFILCDHPMDGITFIPLGIGGEELTRENYDSSVLSQYDAAVDDVMSDKPRGRLIVLDGPPGTGKTFMVRAFMNTASDAKFLIVPPHLIEKLTDPNMIIGLLRDARTSNRPIVLVLEDADQCLSKRKAKNMASISSILNLTDGIVGSLLDLRILATTNTPATQFDEALLRKGRLSAHIRVGELDFTTIENIWCRLAGPKIPNPFAKQDQVPVVLADIYAAYNELSEVDRALGDIAKLADKMN